MEKHRQRMNLVSGLRNLDKSTTDVETLIKDAEEYISFLRGLKSRFRVSSTKAGWGFALNPFAQKSLHIGFTWYGAFLDKYKFTTYDIEHEKAVACFVLAHLHSVQATRAHKKATKDEKEVDQEEVKKCLHSFQAAAGILEHIENQRIPKIHTPRANDLNSKLLAMLKEIMVAQAQECIYEACLAKKVKPATLAALAFGCARKFMNALEYSNGFSASEILRKVAYPWKQHLRYKALCWQASACFQQARDRNEAEEHGKEIGLLEKARSKIQEARGLEKDMRRTGFGGRLKSPLLDALEDAGSHLERAIIRRLEMAKKENEAIYHEKVPPVAKLEDAEPNILAKPAPFVEPLIDPKSPFAVLVPAKIQENGAKFKQEVKEELKSMAADAETKADEIRSKLQALNLPAALDARDGQSGMPEGLWKRIEVMQGKGGVEHVDMLLKQVLSAQDKAWEIFNSIKASLEQEEMDEEKLRKNFGGRWTRAPSKELTVESTKQLTTVEGYLKRAAGADEKLSTRRKKEDPSIQLVRHTREAIEANIPKVEIKQERQETEQEKMLKEDLGKLNLIIETRPKILKLAEEKVDSWDVDSILLEDDRKKVAINETKVRIKSELDPYFTKLRKIDDLQRDLLSSIENKNQEWKDSVSSDPQMALRSEYFGKINAGVEAMETLTSNLLQGLKFYGDVMREYLNPLQQQVRDFVVAREHEAKMHMEHITRAIAASGGNEQQADLSGPSAPAPPAGESSSPYAFGHGIPQRQPVQQVQAHAVPSSGGAYPRNPYAGVAEPVHVSAQPVNVSSNPSGPAPMQVEAMPVSGQHAAPPLTDGEW
eukprot:CAMPEP_0184503426 /NCGR_PEP_ID=MMETSP0113_2-20130426/51885_1 /TAXON_ID=91329 /ORGANISM="Norrisiella sphaerica, Strain BC52" /LENGTH=824 /DNA_ID=CAMNT_0026892921 /DNA_START=239 /DNA_END=2710 /DNA_ORIENTATION=+